MVDSEVKGQVSHLGQSRENFYMSPQKAVSSLDLKLERGS